MNCKYCHQHCIRKGKNGCVQKYRCMSCGKYQQERYRYTSYTISDDAIIQLTKEGLGIRSSSRILRLSPSTTLRRILKIGGKLQRPFVTPLYKQYEVDELFTYIRKKKTGFVLLIHSRKRRVLSSIL